jgi:hypothetical protein
MEKIQIRNQGSRMEKISTQDLGFGMEKIQIRDKHPGPAKLEILSPNLQGLKKLNNNQTLCGKGILGWDQVIFKIYGRISGVKERKNACELDFSISYKTRPPSPNYVP